VNTANGLIGLWLFQKTIPAFIAVKQGVFAYRKELVRYIHFNPLRARLVEDLRALDRYP